MCDGCYRLLSDHEEMVAFKIVDDEDRAKIFKGHKDCVEAIAETLHAIYGLKEEK
jgi:hypothetical protein